MRHVYICTVPSNICIVSSSSLSSEANNASLARLSNVLTKKGGIQKMNTIKHWHITL